MTDGGAVQVGRRAGNVLVGSCAPHVLLTSVSVFLVTFPCTEHRQASAERQEYVR